MDVHFVINCHNSPQRHVRMKGDGNANHTHLTGELTQEGPNERVARFSQMPGVLIRVRAGLPRKNQHANDITSVRQNARAST